MKPNTFSISLLVVISATVFGCKIALARKPYSLKILSLLPFTGTPMIDSRTGQATENMVAEIVNNRSDILPDYHIEFEFRDEADSGMRAATAAVTYVRSMTEFPGEQNTYLAPITAGIFYHPGCKSWGQIAHHMNMVAIASSCTAPSQTARRNLYPNQYRTRSSSQLSLTSRIHFMARIAKWKKIAIMMFMNTNPYNLEAATIVYDACVKAGYEIMAFEASSDFNDELMVTLKKADIRIFTFESAELAITVTFLCQAYKAGIRGPKYLFIFQLLAFADPNLLPPSAFPPGCTKQNYIEQVQASVFIGTPYQVMVPSQTVTQLNHTPADFERLFEDYTNKSRKLDYVFRYLAYDIALHTIVTLDEAEKLLAKQNMSLRDFREHPEAVMLATNKSASQVNFNDLRFGHFHYSKRMEWDYEPQLVITWTPRKGSQVRYTVTLREGADVNDINSYFIKAILPFENDLPKDSGYQTIVMQEVSEPVFGAVLGLSGLTFLLQCFLIVKKTYRVGYKNRNFIGDAVILLSFFVMNAAAVTFATKNEWRTNGICISNVVLTTAGVALFQSCLVLKLLAAYHCFKNALPNFKRARFLSIFTARTRTEKVTLANDEPYVPSTAIAYCFANVIIVLIWQIVDPLRAVTTQLTKVGQYDEASDTYLKFVSVICQSHSAPEWLAGLVAANCLPPFFGVILLLRLRQATRFFARYPELKPLKMAMMCSLTLYFGTVAVAYLSTTGVMFQLTLAFALIIYSTSNAAIIYFKVGRQPSSRLAPNAGKLPAKRQPKSPLYQQIPLADQSPATPRIGNAAPDTRPSQGPLQVVVEAVIEGGEAAPTQPNPPGMNEVTRLEESPRTEAKL